MGTRRVIAGLSSALLSLALLAACSGAGEGSSPGAPAADGATEDQPAESTATVDRSAFTPQTSVDPAPSDADLIERTSVVYVSTDGDDDAAGTSPDTALRTVAEAWNRIPQGTELTEGVTIALADGRYRAEELPNYWESRHGTGEAPIVVTTASSLDGGGDRDGVVLTGGMNVFDTSHLSVLNLTIRPEPAGDAFHCEQCDALLLRNVVLDGGSRTEGARETLKVNQSSDVWIESSDIGGATDNAIDFVAVQGGHLLGNTVHDAEDWCAYAKGGSAYLWVEANTFTRCGTGGFTAGQGTGFEFMTAPWITYEAMGIVVYRNLVIDTDGAGLGINGGYNVVLAHNTLYRVGRRSHVIEVVGGARSCDGNVEQCRARQQAGGWGGTDEGGQWIPGQHLWVVNNLVVNPPDEPSQWAQFAIAGALDAPDASNVAAGARADGDLHIAGNVIANGTDLPLVDGEGCQSEPCTVAALGSANTFTAVQLADPDRGEFGVAAPPGWRAATIEAFDWSDAPLSAPAWEGTPPAVLDAPGADLPGTPRQRP